MARKSSFLSGFETGTAAYSQGVAIRDARERIKMAKAQFELSVAESKSRDAQRAWERERTIENDKAAKEAAAAATDRADALLQITKDREARAKKNQTQKEKDEAQREAVFQAKGGLPGVREEFERKKAQTDREEEERLVAEGIKKVAGDAFVTFKKSILGLSFGEKEGAAGTMKEYGDAVRVALPAISKDPDTLREFDVLHNSFINSQAGVAVRTQKAISEANTIALSKAQTEQQYRDGAERDRFNQKWGVSLGHVADTRYWAERIDTWKDEAKATGKTGSFAEFPGAAKLTPVINDIISAHTHGQTFKADETRRLSQIRLDVEDAHEEKKLTQANKSEFYKFAREVKQLGWKYENPVHQKEFRDTWDIHKYVTQFSKGGSAGINLMNSIRKNPKGGFDNDELVAALGKLEDKILERKNAGQAVNLTEPQSKTVMYGVAMFQAQQTLDALSKKGYHALTVKDRALYKAGTVYKMSSNGQVYVSAMSNWNNAVLRKDSGAAITLAEVENYEKALFPRFGEKEAGIKAKKKVRDARYKALKWSGGPGPYMKQFWTDMEAEIGGVGATPQGRGTDGGLPPVPPEAAGSPRYPGIRNPPQPDVGGESNVITGSGSEINSKIMQLIKDGDLKYPNSVRFVNPQTGSVESYTPWEMIPAPNEEDSNEEDSNVGDPKVQQEGK